MPWKASSVMEERMRFVTRLPDGEAMTEVCREFGISRQPATRFSIVTRRAVAARLRDLPPRLWGTHYSSCASVQACPCKPLGVEASLPEKFREASRCGTAL
jgi:hypothetical protein